MGDAVDAGKRAAADGELIVEKAREDFALRASDDEGDGPMMQHWLRGDRLPKPASPASLISDEQAWMIANIVSYERAGRWIAASMGLARLRERYEATTPRDLPADEQTWEAFAAKHVPLPAQRVAELIGRMVHSGAIRCMKCRAGSTSACGCGVPYVGDHRWAMRAVQPARPPKAGSALDRAAAAIAADPAKSNRAIAAEIGVSAQTVKRAREKIADAGDDVAPDVAPDRRVGRDGRSYPAARPEPAIDHDLIQDMHPDAVTPEQRWQWSALTVLADLVAARAYWKREFGDWKKFRPPSEIAILVEEATNALQAIASDLERRKDNDEAART